MSIYLPPPVPDSIVIPPNDTIVTPPNDTIVTPPNDTIVTPPNDTIVTPPNDTVISSELASSLNLRQNLIVYPNPFRDKVLIGYFMRSNGNLEISVLDQSGRLIRNLFSGYSVAAESTLIWDGSMKDGSESPPGLYIIRMVTSDSIFHIKVLRR